MRSMRLQLLVLCALPFLVGCMRLDIAVKIHETGGATITEKIAFSEELLDLAAAAPQDSAVLNKALSKEGAQERMAKMGTGVALSSFDVSDQIYSGVLFKQATAVYTIPDVNNLRLTPPYPNVKREADEYLGFSLEPCYQRPKKDAPGGIDLPGWMVLDCHLAGKPVKGAEKLKSPAAPSPAKAEETRELLPIVQDLLRSFSAKITIEAYDKLYRSWWFLGGAHSALDRDCTHAAAVVELLNISGENCDTFNHPILADEAALLELLRNDWAGGHFFQMLYENWSEGYKFLKNSRLPLVYPNGDSLRFIVMPSEHFYKKHFDGKTFDDPFAPPRLRAK